MEIFFLSLLCKYLGWMVQRPMILFIKFLEFVKVVK